MKKEGRKPLVLVADDVEACQADIAYVVEGLGARVCFAKNVKGALLKAAMHGPLSDDPLNLVIVDMHMPFDETQTAIDKEAGIRVLNSYRLVTCPVVVFTAYPSYSTCVKVIKLGAYAYVTTNENEILGGKE